MKYNFRLLVFCINCSLLSLFVGRSYAGVGNLCKDGKFFDRSKQQYVPCRECKDELQHCFSCCTTNANSQGEESNTTKLSSSKPHPRPQEQTKKETSSSGDSEQFLPNILVVSITSFFILVSLVILLLVIIKSSTCCGGEAGERAPSDSQRSDIVTEVIMMEPIDSIETASSDKGADMDANVNDSQTGSVMLC